VALADVTMSPTRRAPKLLLEAADRESTPLFRAPELFAMSLHSHLDAKTDVWALGCTLFAMLFGESPFERASAQGSIDLGGAERHNTSCPIARSTTCRQSCLRIMSRMLALDA
jgi:serine/threonine protein kinase